MDSVKARTKKKKNAEERKFKKKETKVFKALSANWNDLKDFDTRTKKNKKYKEDTQVLKSIESEANSDTTETHVHTRETYLLMLL